MYACFFYLQRSLIIGILIFKFSFGVQMALLQISVLANALFLFTTRPYQSEQDAFPD